jgi:hypothetical protein
VHVRALVDLVKAGTPRAEPDRLSAEENRRIRRELVEPHGVAGEVAAEDAADRMPRGIRLLADHFEVDLGAEDA